MKFFLPAMALFAAIILPACSTSQGDIQQKVDNRVLSTTVGKPYEKYAALRKTTLEGLFANDKAYGELFAVEPLQNGDTLYRHMDRYESSGSRSSLGNLVSKQTTNHSYRLIYFRVGQDGKIRDYANGFLTGESNTCVGWIHGIFQKCEDQEVLLRTIRQYDQMVTISSGQPVSSWVGVI